MPLVKNSAVIAALFLWIIACTAPNKIVPVRLYDLSTAEVIQAHFEFSGTQQGRIGFELPSGEKFQGEYNTIVGGTTGWGRIYGSVWGSGGSSVVTGGGSMVSAPTEYKGAAVMTSDRGTIITCEYV